MLSKKMGKEIVLNKGEYTDKELNAIIGHKMKLRMNDRDDVLRTSRLYGGTKITISLNELDNSDNLEDGHPSNTLFMYYVTDPEYFMHLKPQSPQYRKLKNINITDGQEITVVLHMCMIKIFRGGQGGDTFKTPSPPMNNFCLHPPPVLICL